MKNNDTSKKYKIVFTDYYFEDIHKEIKILNKLGNVEIIDCNDFISGEIGNEEKILTYIKRTKAIDADALIVNHAIIGKKIISQLKNCKIIARYGVGVDNVVTDENHQIVDIIAGELLASWQQGVEVCKKIYLCPIEKKADVVIASAGGYPKDINVYQAQKALDNAYQAVKSGGTIILVAECSEGYGEPIFEKWIEEANAPEDIIKRLKKKFVLGGHKAYSIAKLVKGVEVIFISSLPSEKVRKLFFIPMENISQALEYIQGKYGEDFQAYVLPSGNTVLPQIT
jgi:nickel-dependent lactate racemase